MRFRAKKRIFSGSLVLILTPGRDPSSSVQPQNTAGQGQTDRTTVTARIWTTRVLRSALTITRWSCWPSVRSGPRVCWRSRFENRSLCFEWCIIKDRELGQPQKIWIMRTNRIIFPSCSSLIKQRLRLHPTKNLRLEKIDDARQVDPNFARAQSQSLVRRNLIVHLTKDRGDLGRSRSLCAWGVRCH